MKPVSLAVLMLTFALPATAPAVAQSAIAEVICAPTAQMERRLTEQMHATRRSTGVRDREQVMEVWTDARDEWVLVARYASGTSCILAMGAHWMDIPGADPA
jgi:hypothetical protein